MIRPPPHRYFCGRLMLRIGCVTCSLCMNSKKIKVSKAFIHWVLRLFRLKSTILLSVFVQKLRLGGTQNGY